MREGIHLLSFYNLINVFNYYICTIPLTVGFNLHAYFKNIMDTMLKTVIEHKLKAPWANQADKNPNLKNNKASIIPGMKYTWKFDTSGPCNNANPKLVTNIHPHIYMGFLWINN